NTDDSAGAGTRRNDPARTAAAAAVGMSLRVERELLLLMAVSVGNAGRARGPAGAGRRPEERLRLARLVARGGNLFPGFGRRGGGGLVALLLDLVADSLQPLLELNDPLAQRTAHLRQALSEQEQADAGDDEPLHTLGHPH